MIDKIIEQEEDLLATLITIRDLTIEHNIFPLKGMIDQLDILIKRSQEAINIINGMKNDKLGEL